MQSVEVFYFHIRRLDFIYIVLRPKADVEDVTLGRQSVAFTMFVKIILNRRFILFHLTIEVLRVHHNVCQIHLVLSKMKEREHFCIQDLGGPRDKLLDFID